MQVLSDKELFEKIQARDNKALEMLFERYYNTLCNFAVKITQEAEGAEEVVADVFYILWTKANQIEIESSVKGYLFAAVKHKAFEVIRLKKHEFASIDKQHDIPTIDPYHPENSLLYNELMSEYQKAYESLPKQCKLVFKLCKLDGLKYKEISHLLNISTKTVENQMTKALRLIREQVRQYQYERL